MAETTYKPNIRDYFYQPEALVDIQVLESYIGHDDIEEFNTNRVIPERVLDTLINDLQLSNINDNNTQTDQLANALSLVTGGAVGRLIRAGEKLENKKLHWEFARRFSRLSNQLLESDRAALSYLDFESSHIEETHDPIIQNFANLEDIDKITQFHQSLTFLYNELNTSANNLILYLSNNNNPNIDTARDLLWELTDRYRNNPELFKLDSTR